VTAKTKYTHPSAKILRPSEEDLLQAWKDLVIANAEQKARLRETTPKDDYWGQYADGFVQAKEQRANQEQLPFELKAMQAFAVSDDVWMDVGAGVGGDAIYLSQFVNHMVTYDESPGMTARMREYVKEKQAANVEVLACGSWPALDSESKTVDVTYATHVINFVEDIGAFLDAIERQTRRLCIINATELGSFFQPVEPIFKQLYDEKYIRPPALAEFLAVLGARRRVFNIQTESWDAEFVIDLDEAHNNVRKFYWLQEGSKKDKLLKELLLKNFGVENNQVRYPSPAGNRFCVISWRPPEQ